MAKPLDAIPTIYGGVQMRSRFEANVAELLDSIGQRWLYEPQSFLLDGVHYRPDFYLPDASTWIEVRGYESAHGEAQISAFARRVMAGCAGVEARTRTGDPDRDSSMFLVLRSREVRCYWHLRRFEKMAAAGCQLYFCASCHLRYLSPPDELCSDCRRCGEYAPIELGTLRVEKGKTWLTFGRDGESEFKAGARCAITRFRLELLSTNHPDRERVEPYIEHPEPERMVSAFSFATGSDWERFQDGLARRAAR